MTYERTCDPLNAPEIFFDGIHEIKIIEGVVRSALYSLNASGEKQIVVRLAIPVSELPAVLQATMMALTQTTKIAASPSDETAH
jgi:hypothetical protein